MSEADPNTDPRTRLPLPPPAVAEMKYREVLTAWTNIETNQVVMSMDTNGFAHADTPPASWGELFGQCASSLLRSMKNDGVGHLGMENARVALIAAFANVLDVGVFVDADTPTSSTNDKPN